ncbi:MAG: 2,4-dihydroxyhept-2-ene-1,7-dioic acid aldolase [Verrucomicrobia bacterium RIFCSPLOWO2_12_FULL_64_8]|nr:MAG: 2,4-dihydroxyhept-2-ene-1,7-dioic acid aldolase [Verrucomicrobia bacterium RIFCSPLOWO2_12_FULL_64_8]
MKENTVKRIWADGGAVVNGWLCIPSTMSAEIMAGQGFDSIVVDLQHGAIDYQVAVTLFQAICTTPVIPLARVPWNDPGILMKVLDAGAYGVICPMINNAEEAEKLVQACKYPPRGYRSVGPIRAKYAWHVPPGTDYIDFADASTLVIPQIETAEALENLDRILEVSGIDAVYVGPGDLAMGLGSHARTGQNDAVVVAAKKKVAEACARHGKYAGMHTPSAEAAYKAVGAGFRFVTIASDDRFLAAKASAEVKALRTAMQPQREVPNRVA